MTAARSARIADQIQRELAELVRLEVRDPRVGLITLTGVELSRDQSHAKVFFTTLGGPQASADALEGLTRAAGFLRSQLAHRLTTRKVPELHFEFDESVERGVRLSRLIDEAIRPAGAGPQAAQPQATLTVAPESPSGLLLLDKPEGFSSTQALGRAKRLLAIRKGGHTGTLDPFATGLLPLVFGEATKFSRFLLDAVKSYHATLRLGVESTTGDTEGTLTPPILVSANLAQIEEVLASFVGDSSQIPPMHSAVRLAGKRLYELAREGQDVPRAPRQIHIQALNLERHDGDCLVISVTCSKGTYVRTLAADIGRALGCGAYLTALRRTAIGPLGIEQAVTLEQLATADPDVARSRLLPVETLVSGLPRLEAASAESVRFTQGQLIDCAGAGEGSEWAVHAPDGTFLGVGRAEVPGRLSPVRLMATGEARVA